MKKFKVSYYWRTAGGDIDWETHEVEASNEEEAEEKIMEKLGRVKGFYKVKVEPINQFGRMQELAGVNSTDETDNTGLRKQLEDIILSYCEGNEWLEFSKNDLPEMTERILGLFE